MGVRPHPGCVSVGALAVFLVEVGSVEGRERAGAYQGPLGLYAPWVPVPVSSWAVSFVRWGWLIVLTWGLHTYPTWTSHTYSISIPSSFHGH